jgi:hypothetical protein
MHADLAHIRVHARRPQTTLLETPLELKVGFCECGKAEMVLYSVYM